MSDRRLPDTAEVAIVGAGLAGLAAARAVAAGNRSAIVVEASDGVGGRVRTDDVDGHLLDRGFQVLLTAYPELHAQLDVPALDLRTFEPGALVWTGRRMHLVGDPVRRPSTLGRTLRAPVGSIADKLRLLTQRMRLLRSEPVDLLRQHDQTTLAALEEDGFSERVIERFFRPFVGGIQLDPSLETSRRIFDVILRCLLADDVAVPARGMGAIPAQLAAQLPPEAVHLRRKVVAVNRGEVVMDDGHRIAAGAVIVATDGPTASELLGLPPVASNPATCVWFSARHPPFRDRYIMLDPTGAGPASNVAVMTNVAPEYASDGSAVIAAACPGANDPHAEPSVRAQLRLIWGAEVDDWEHLRTDAIPHGQPQQRPPFSPKQPVALGEGLFVAGDHRDTASIQGALYSGRRCAEAVLSAPA